jgi:glutathione S-transferase
MVLTLYDAARCPFVARIRIVLAEKDIPYEPVEIDLDSRPAWLYEKNPAGRVPVLEEDGGFVLPESRVIMEYLEDRFPEPALLPADPAGRALVRLRIERFDDFSRPYYELRKRPGGATDRLDEELARLDQALAELPFLSGAEYGLADIAYLPWILRAESFLGVEVRTHVRLADWLERVSKRRAVAQEIELLGLVAAARA